MSIRLDQVFNLSIHAGPTVFSYVDAKMLGRCCQVSKTWKKKASNGALWRSLFPTVTIPQEVDAKTYLDDHAVGSTEELMKRIQKFAQQVSFDQRGIFSCQFAYNPKYMIEATFQYGSLPLPTWKKMCLFTCRLCDDTALDVEYLERVSHSSSWLNNEDKWWAITTKVTLPTAFLKEGGEVSRQIGSVLATRKKRADQTKKSLISWASLI